MIRKEDRMNRRIVRVISSLVIALSIFPSSRLSARCGVEGWSVKTEADMQQVDLANPKQTTNAELIQLPLSRPIPSNNRVAGTSRRSTRRGAQSTLGPQQTDPSVKEKEAVHRSLNAVASTAQSPIVNSNA